MYLNGIWRSENLSTKDSNLQHSVWNYSFLPQDHAFSGKTGIKPFAFE